MKIGGKILFDTGLVVIKCGGWGSNGSGDSVSCLKVVLDEVATVPGIRC